MWIEGLWLAMNDGFFNATYIIMLYMAIVVGNAENDDNILMAGWCKVLNTAVQPYVCRSGDVIWWCRVWLGYALSMHCHQIVIHSENQIPRALVPHPRHCLRSLSKPVQAILAILATPRLWNFERHGNEDHPVLALLLADPYSHTAAVWSTAEDLPLITHKKIRGQLDDLHT